MSWRIRFFREVEDGGVFFATRDEPISVETRHGDYFDESKLILYEEMEWSIIGMLEDKILDEKVNFIKEMTQNTNLVRSN